MGLDDPSTLDIDSILVSSDHVPGAFQMSDFSADLIGHSPAKADNDDFNYIDILSDDVLRKSKIITFHSNVMDFEPDESDWNIFNGSAIDHPPPSLDSATLSGAQGPFLGVGARYQSANVLISSMSGLYTDYLKSSAQLNYVNSMTSDKQQPKSDAFETPPALGEASEEVAMSRSQLALANEEGKLWDSLVDQPYHDARAHAYRLVEKSKTMSQSYMRRSTPPTITAYEQCQELIKAMGIPCIETSGPYEAEALASSLVINGLADYVASEDTVSKLTHFLAYISLILVP
jgi:hypothetical protein